MFTITRITVQRKRKNRYNVFIKQAGQDKERYGFSLEEDTLIKDGVRKGQTLDQAAIDGLMKQDRMDKAYHRALGYLGHRMRSIKEMRTYLYDKEIDEEQVKIVIKRLLEQKFLDDEAFAIAYVRTKVKTTFRGPGVIKRELFQKGVHSEMIDLALKEYPESEQVRQISKWLAKQIKKTSRDSHRHFQMKRRAQLADKGFSQDVINEALDITDMKKGEEDEWQALIYQGERALRRYQRKSEGYQLTQKIKASLYQKGFNQDLINRFIDHHLE